MRIPLTITIVALFLLGPVYPGGYRFESISSEDGLSQNTVDCILQDSNGFMWFGTWDGLNRFDGYQFEVFKPVPGDSNSISHNVIRTMLLDSKGFLWVGTENGLNRFNPENEKFRQFKHDPEIPNSLSHNLVYTIFEDSDGMIWIGTKGGGINKYNAKTENFTIYKKNKNSHVGLKSDYVYCFLEDTNEHNKILWIGTEYGLSVYHKKKKQFVNNPPEINPKLLSMKIIILTMFRDSEDNIWIGTWGEGLIKYNTTTNEITKFKHLPHSNNCIPGNIVNAIYEDENKNLWIGTRNGGLCRLGLQSGQIEQYPKKVFSKYGLNDNSILSIYQNNAGILWFGTFRGGINKLNKAGKPFNTLQHDPFNDNSLNDNDITSIYADDSVLWIGTQNKGLNKFDLKTKNFIHYTHQPGNSKSLSNNTIHTIYKDERGWLWVGTDGGGLNKINPESGSFVHYKYQNKQQKSVSNNYIYSFLNDRNNVSWIGSWGADERRGGIDLYFRDSKKFINIPSRYKDPEGISKNIILCLMEDNDGNIWAGSKEQGLNKIILSKNNPEKYIDKVVVYKHTPGDTTSLGHNDIFSLYQDQSGTIWIGTGGGGLNRYNPENNTFTLYDESDGLTNGIINGILEDDHNNLWLSSGNGLFRFNPRRESFKHYDHHDGLPCNVFNRGASFKTENGMLYFGSVNGLVFFHPDSIKDNRHIPPIVFTNFKIFNEQVEIGEYYDRKKLLDKSINFTKAITIPFPYNFFSIEFAALDYAIPGKNEYKYKLEGFNDKWVHVDASRRFATYTNLNPGKYRFTVKGSNNDGYWNEEGKSIKIVVLPPFYKSIWFKLLISSLAVFLIILLFYRINKRTHKEKQEIRKKAQESLFDERNQLRTLIDNLPDYIYIKDTRSRFVTINKRLARVMGNRTPNEVIGTTDFDFYDKDLAQKYYSDEQEIMRNKEPMINIEEPGTDEEGRARYILTTKAPIINKKNEVAGVVGIGRDITELKETQKKLVEQTEYLKEINVLLEERQEEIYQQSEELSAQAENLKEVNKELEKLSLVASKTDNSVIILDEKFNIEWVNEGFYRLYGFTTDEVIGKHSIHDLGDYFSPELNGKLEICATEKRSVAYESLCTDKKGKKYWFQTNLTPIINVDDEVEKIIAIDSDISELKEAKIEIEAQRDELTKLNATKDKFFSIIAHDLKNPFHAIIGFTDLLSQNFRKIKDSEKLELIDLINTTTKSTYNLLENLLHWARTQTNAIKFKPAKISITEIINENVRFLQLNANKKKIALKSDVKKNLMVFADSNMINTVLRNLLNNALKFTDHGGEVIIDAKELNGHVEISVSDTGIGMDQNTIDNLFKIEEYKTTQGTSGETGTGLGLIICHEFVKKNGGKLYVESEKGKYTTFYFTIPKV